MLYTKELANELKIRAGEKWMPCNGTEAEIFMKQFCDRCTKDDGEEKLCEIMFNTMTHDIEHKEYPQEWQYGSDGQPVCTAFDERTKDTKAIKNPFLES